MLLSKRIIEIMLSYYNMLYILLFASVLIGVSILGDPIEGSTTI